MNKASKLSIVVVLFFEMTLLLNVIQALGGKQWKDLGLAALAMVALTIPFLLKYLANRTKLKLPPGFLLIGAIFIYLAQYFGEIRKFYQNLWWWDLLLHGAFGLLAVLFAVYVLKSNIMPEEHVSDTRFTFFIAFMSLSFSIASSASWELFEFIGDMLLPVRMVKGGLEDSMSDLLIGTMIALITAICYYFLSNHE